MSENKLPNIPKEWKWVRLEKIGKLIKGVSYKKEFSFKISKEDYIAILRANNIKNGEINFNDLIYVPISYVKDEQKIRAGDILIAMSSGSKDLVGKAAQSEQNYNASFGAFCGLIRFSTQINKKYFGFYFQSKEYKNYISKLSSGININNLRRKHIENINLPFAPLPEQQKIVEILEKAFSKIDSGVEGLKKIKRLLSLYRQSILKYAFEGKLTEKWRKKNKDKLESPEKLIEKIKKEREERYKQELKKWEKISKIAKKEGKKKPPKPKPPKELSPITEEELKNLPHIPKEWTLVKVGDIIKKCSLTGKKVKQSQVKNEGKFPVVDQGQDIISGYVDDENLVIDCEPPIIVFGDHTKIIKYLNFKFVAGADGIKAFKVIGYEPKAFYYLLKAIKLPEKGYARHFQFLEKSFIPFLSSLEQQKIVEEIEYRLSIADKLEESVDKLLNLSEKLKQSYLKYAFEGKLTKEWRKQNSHLVSGENSVDILLKKIKKEKFEKKKKSNKTKIF